MNTKNQIKLTVLANQEKAKICGGLRLAGSALPGSLYGFVGEIKTYSSSSCACTGEDRTYDINHAGVMKYNVPGSGESGEG